MSIEDRAKQIYASLCPGRSPERIVWSDRERAIMLAVEEALREDGDGTVSGRFRADRPNYSNAPRAEGPVVYPLGPRGRAFTELPVTGLATEYRPKTPKR